VVFAAAKESVTQPFRSDAKQILLLLRYHFSQGGESNLRRAAKYDDEWLARIPRDSIRRI